MTHTPLQRITIIGLGLIGSSIARAAKASAIETVVGCDTNSASLSIGRTQGCIDIAIPDLATAARDSQLIILATPPAALGDIMRTIAPSLSIGSVVMDVSSVKEPAIHAISSHLPAGVEYIPAHPIAGSEQSGIRAGRADLFANKLVVLCPAEPKQTPGLTRAMEFWKRLGARTQAMPADLHDVLYGYVSHLPQLLAYAAAEVLHSYADDETLSRFLRIAHSNRTLWSDIFALNTANITTALDRYLDAIAHVSDELANAPADAPASDNGCVVAATTLFPRIAASCLITTVMEAEKNHGVPFAPFAGTGFADFTSPATENPEQDIEHIAQHYDEVRSLLIRYIDALHMLRQQYLAQ